MRLIDADAVKEALRNRIGENIDECINNVPTVDVLEQIRAEIENLDTHYDNDYFSGNNDPMYKCNEVLQIIDKYK